MVFAWAADTTPLLEEEIYQRYYERLPGWRKDKADNCKMTKEKVLSVAAWTLWEYVRGHNPQILSNDVVYNLSHSGHYVMCAYSDKSGVKVGCDLEMIGKQRLSVAKRFFCETEYQHIMNTASEEEQRRLFYRYWVLKESFMKATREGMALGIDSFEIGWDDNGEPILIKQPETYPEAYFYKEYTAEGVEASMAVCTTDEEIENELHWMTL